MKILLVSQRTMLLTLSYEITDYFHSFLVYFCIFKTRWAPYSLVSGWIWPRGRTVSSEVRRGYLFPGILSCGSLQPPAHLNQPDPRPFPHSSSDWRKHSPPPFRPWVVKGLAFTRSRALHSPCAVFTSCSDLYKWSLY